MSSSSSTDPSAASPPQAQQLASIFQKAYARAVALQRMDEQIGALLEQRQRLENEFRDAQSEVNVECERMLRSTSIAPAKILAQLAAAGAEAGADAGAEGGAETAETVEVTTDAAVAGNGRMSRKPTSRS